jgi:hypothetical protein
MTYGKWKSFSMEIRFHPQTPITVTVHKKMDAIPSQLCGCGEEPINYPSWAFNPDSPGVPTVP